MPNTHRTSAVVALLVAGCALFTHAAGAGGIDRPHPVEIRYLRHIDEPSFRTHYPRAIWSRLYWAVAIRSRFGTTHRLRANPEYGVFVATDEPHISPGGKYVVVEQLAAGYVEDGERRVWHEVNYCVFIDADTAQLVRRETGGYCGGEFTGPSTWKSIDGLTLELKE